MTFPPLLLVIDDEPDNFDVIEALLHSEGYQLHYSRSGQRALTLLDSFQPDVILLDVMMPDMDGIEVCRQIKAMPSFQATPIIMVTALTAKEDLANCLATGADDFISKPINGLELRARVKSMLRIKQNYDHLQSLLKFRSDMVDMIVHDLRNPLASILLSTEILRLGISPEKQQSKLDQMAIAGRQLQSMIDSLLLMAKLEAGKMVLTVTDVDLRELCTSVITNFEPIAAQKSLELTTQLPTPGGRLSVDAVLIRRMLDNLLANAIKFSPSKSQVNLSADYLQTGARIQVADSGPGIPANLRQQIFEKYEVGTPISGTSQIGLGLTFCKLVIDAHGGEIEIEDNQPQGALFSIFLPNSPKN